MNIFIEYSLFIYFLPLGAFFINIFLGKKLPRQGDWISIGAVLLSLALSIAMFIGMLFSYDPGFHVESSFTWLSLGAFQIQLGFLIDNITIVMLLVVALISTMSHIFSIKYMEGDPHYSRFYAYLSLFTFSMNGIVLSNNLMLLYMSWELVGLSSYLLIGFWFEKQSAADAGIKAFLTNRVGDIGFFIGIMLLFTAFGSVLYSDIFYGISQGGLSGTMLTLAGIGLFIGAMGKSAQLGLHTWLPDAMEGPTPVSALIHAATMVTAGIFMVVRLSPIFEYAPLVLNVICVIGASTAFFAATVALCQNDIKRVIAYSTCSQLGYMFFACGISAYAAGIFNLFTHAFFKAFLFLGAGSVIHAMSSEQDMQKMGGIWRLVPLTYIMMWIGSLALTGLPFFSGFYSKDIIIEAAFAANSSVGFYAFWLGIAAAVMTAFYSWRLLFLTFHGTPRADEKTMAHVHESPKTMTIPLIILAFGAIFSGLIGYNVFVGDGMEKFWKNSIILLPEHRAIFDAHLVPLWVKSAPIVVGIIGIAFAYYFYKARKDLPEKITIIFPKIYLFLYNKWFFDELYELIFVRPAKYLGKGLWKEGDGSLIDGLGPDGLATVIKNLAGRISLLQTGYVYHYAFAMLIGVAGLVTLYLYAQAG